MYNFRGIVLLQDCKIPTIYENKHYIIKFATWLHKTLQKDYVGNTIHAIIYT